VFDSGKSVLLVPAGCVGGPGITDPSETLACGNAYSPATPTPTLIALGMHAAAPFDKVSLQAVHANIAMPTVDVRLDRGESFTFLVAPLLSGGAIGPKPPYTDLALDDFGLLSDVSLPIHWPGDSTTPLAEVPLEEALEQGGLTDADFANGAPVALVAVGSAPGLPGGSWWHRLTFVAVLASPD
jgi:hypothetical protein